MSVLSQRRTSGRWPGGNADVLSVLVLALAAVGWSVLVVGWRFGWINPPAASGAMKLVLYGMPISLIVLLGRYRSLRSQPLGVVTTWTVIVAAAFALTPHLITSSTLAFGIPAGLAAAWVVSRRPDIALFLIAIVTASYGSLHIYLGFHYLKTTDLLLAGLWLGLIGKLVLGSRAQRMWLSSGAAVAAVYLSACFLQVLLSPDQHGALSAFEAAPLWMMTFLVVGYSGWSRGIHLRVVRAILLTAVAVGAYATLRYIIGPSSKEYAAAAQSGYNFVNGRMKLLGSFTSGADLGAWTTLMLPFALACMLGLRDRWRLVAATALPLLAIGLIGSQLRAGAVAVILAGLITLLLYQVARAYPSGVRLGRGLLALVSAVVIGLGAFTIVASRGGNIGQRYTNLLTLNSNDVSFSQHQYKWQTAFRDLGGHPFGYGLGTAAIGGVAPKVGAAFRTPVNSFSVDSGYLKIALEQGFILTIVFAISLVLLLGGLAWRGVGTTDPIRATIAIGAAGSIASLIVLEGAGAFIESVPVILTWVVVGLGLAQFQGESRGQGQRHRPGD